MTSLTIRRATPEDLPRITELWKEMMDYHLSLDPRFEMSVDSKEAYLDYLFSVLDNYDYAIFAAVKKKEIIGYTIGMILANPPVFALDRYGFIAEMAVTASERRSGMGHQMWDHIRQWFKRRGIDVVQLNVSPLNERGYKFWQESGCDEFLHIMWHNIPKDL